MTQPYVFNITSQPYARVVNPFDSAGFSFGIDASSSVTWQWYIKPKYKSTFTKLSNTGPFSGATEQHLHISSCDTLNGSNFKCVVTRSDNGKKLTSNIVSLTTDCSVPVQGPNPEQ